MLELELDCALIIVAEFELIHSASRFHVYRFDFLSKFPNLKENILCRYVRLTPNNVTL